MKLFTNQKQTHTYLENKLMVTREEGSGEMDRLGVWD